jgi:hypothetical protein
MLEHKKNDIFIMNQPKNLMKKPFKNLSRWSKPSQINYNKLSLNQMNDTP